MPLYGCVNIFVLGLRANTPLSNLDSKLNQGAIDSCKLRVRK
jgi:hypothetical protein